MVRFGTKRVEASPPFSIYWKQKSPHIKILMCGLLIYPWDILKRQLKINLGQLKIVA